jgi:hypothetical protein
MKRVAIVLLTILFVSFSSYAFSEDKKVVTPEQQQQMMEQSMNAMLPFMGQMMKIMMKVQFEVLADPSTAEQLAIYTRNYYEALIKKGFTKEEALKIAMNMGIPSLPSMQK